MVENNLAVSFDSDNPAVFNTSLSWQYQTVVAKMKLKKDVLPVSIKVGIDHSAQMHRSNPYIGQLMLLIQDNYLFWKNRVL